MMPRTARAVSAGMIYHVINRGNGRMRLFRKEGDYAAFEKVLGEGLERYPVDLLAYCLMPNHWHLVLRPRSRESLGRLMGWVGVTHVRRHHAHYHSAGGGHLYQGRFKSFPVQEDFHFLVLCRYVEANARRAGLCEKASKWSWGSTYARSAPGGKPPLSDWPVPRPGNWDKMLEKEQEKVELEGVRSSLRRGRPLGEEKWVRQTARRLGLDFTLRERGRPRKEPKESEGV